MVFVPKAERLSAADEKAIYDLHENSLDDQGYGRFLSRAMSPLLTHLAPLAGKTGLDFGAGPAPLLAKMLEQEGATMAIFDAFYANNPDVLTKQYDFITCTEVIEHLHHPKTVLEQLFAMLKPGAGLVIMTKLVIDQTRFATWHYKNDLTHVCFFSRATFAYIAKQFQCDVQFYGQDVMFLQMQK